jgi:small GTP-binding protein
MPSLPTRLADLRNLLEALDWDRLSMRVEEEAHTRIAIVGPVNAGKSTLFNLIKGRRVSAVTAVPGTTKGLVTEQVGPFTLVDTPGFGEVGGVDRAAVARTAAEQADVAVLLLDAGGGLRQSDYQTYEALRAANVPLIVALNKIDLIKRDLAVVLEDAERKLGTRVIPISAKTGAGVADRLIPAIADAHPWVGVALGRALPAYRRQVALRMTRSAALLNAIIAAQPVPGLDIPFLLAAQVRLVLRIAAVYGESLSVRHARELLTTMAGGVAIRYLAGSVVKVVPGPGWLVSAVINGWGTWVIGQVAIAYFAGGKRLTPQQLRERYQRMSRRLLRWRRPAREGAVASADASDAPGDGGTPSAQPEQG